MLSILGNTGRRVFVIVGGVIVGFGIPFFWVWVGSRFQGGTAPSGGAILVVLTGVVASYAGLAFLIGWVNARIEARSGEAPRVKRASWNRSMRDEPLERGKTRHTLESVVIAATLIAAAAMTVWFFFFADPGNIPGQG